MRNSDGLTALQAASEAGYHEVVRCCLNHGAPVTATRATDGYTSIHLAARGGHDRVLAALTDHKYAGPAIYLDALTGLTKCAALYLAAERGHHECVRVLVKRGANPYLTGPDGFTPLHAAARCNSYKTLKVLIRAGVTADVTVPSTGVAPQHGSLRHPRTPRSYEPHEPHEPHTVIRSPARALEPTDVPQPHSGG